MNINLLTGRAKRELEQAIYLAARNAKKMSPNKEDGSDSSKDKPLTQEERLLVVRFIRLINLFGYQKPYLKLLIQDLESYLENLPATLEAIRKYKNAKPKGIKGNLADNDPKGAYLPVRKQILGIIQKALTRGLVAHGSDLFNESARASGNQSGQVAPYLEEVERLLELATSCYDQANYAQEQGDSDTYQLLRDAGEKHFRELIALINHHDPTPVVTEIVDV